LSIVRRCAYRLVDLPLERLGDPYDFAPGRRLRRDAGSPRRFSAPDVGMTDIAIIGLGSWGLSVLERTVNRARASTAPVCVHVVQPGPPGGGVYSLDQPDYLVLNNACGQLSLYAAPDDSPEPRYALGLFDWAVARGYEWHGYECRAGGGGRPLQPTDYLPRRVMGEYLVWFYETLVADAPPNLQIVRHDTTATDIVPDVSGGERVLLDDGTDLRVDHVVLTSGHTWNDERTSGSSVAYRRPYPVDYWNRSTPAGAPVAVAGMGLVGYDMLAALTIGRGGSFEDNGTRNRYVRSGHEPTIYYYSRTGMPCCAKSATGIDPTGTYRPVVCTPDVFARLRGEGAGATRRHVDFRRDLLPLLFDEMQVRFHTQSALLHHGAEASTEVNDRLRAGWAGGDFGAVVTDLEGRYGRFVPTEHLFAGQGSHYSSSRDYESQVYAMVEADLDEALMEGGSAVKAAQEVMRILRDQLRSVIEFGGLSLESYVDFQSNIRGRINRLEAGPPPMRSQQLLALLDAGVVRIPFGPAPEVSAVPDGRVAIRSTQLDRMHAATMTAVVRGHLDLPSLQRSASPLLKRLYNKGRLTQLQYGDTAVGSVAISEDFHPYDAEGRLQQHLSLLGVLTEGVRYFTHYLPSPKSRLRAVLDAQACIEAVIA
jgi:uncharacterized NAD(P)/FAD-binding protein YdhS